MRIIMELRRRFLAKWRGRKGGISSAGAKADIKNFFSVVNNPIDLPESMLDMLVLLVIPPDPLHVTLLGKFSHNYFFYQQTVPSPVTLDTIQIQNKLGITLKSQITVLFQHSIVKLLGLALSLGMT